MGCLSLNLGVQNTFSEEPYVATATTEISYKKGWLTLWLECDSQLVIYSFSNHSHSP
jgi:hypothetical protein